MQTDILQSDFTFPSRVYIVGSGKSASINAARIPVGSFIIACNRAIELVPEATIWLCHDPAIAKNDWFNDRIARLVADKHPCDIKHIGAGKPTIPVFSMELRKMFPVVKVVFKSEGDVYQPLDRSLGYLSPRATVCGQALQLAYMLGSKEVVLIGVDMQGDHFSGEPGYKGDWPCKPEFDWLVKWVSDQGMKVTRIEDMPEETEKFDPRKKIHDIVKRFDMQPLVMGAIEPDIEYDLIINIIKRKGMEPVVSLLPKSDNRPCVNKQPDMTGSPRQDRDLPSIGYLCMTYDDIDRMNAVFDFQQQDYPGRKVLYLLHQRNSFGQFPGETWNNSGLNIVDVNCEGHPWPEMWTFKFMRYLEACDCEYTIWWDEDDRYPADYTRLAMQPILYGLGKLAWSWDMTVAEYVVENRRYEYRADWYRSPIATMVIETELLRMYSNRLWAILYDGDIHMVSTKRKRNIPYGGAQDDQLRQMIQHDNDSIPHHRAIKMYTVHPDANSAQLRAKGNALNYNGRRGTEEEREPQPTRFDTPRSE